MIDYHDFLKSKVKLAHSFGVPIEAGEINPALKPHQAAIVRWLVEGGRRACFAAFGLGKSVIQLETLRLTLAKTGGRALIVCPLAVAQEFRNDAADILGWGKDGAPRLPLFVRRIDEFVVSVSGGLSSIEALERTLQQKGRERVAAVFADVGRVVESGVTVCGEDDDLLRFLSECEAWLGFPIHRVRHAKYQNVWDAFFGERFMGNSRIDTCSKFLKREVLDGWIESYHPGAIRVVGFSWLEKHRHGPFLEYFPDAWFPLCEPPYVTNDEIAEKWEARGIRRSRAYHDGFSHDNCGGMCVKMGLGQAHDLWRLRRKRYLYNERRELEFRREINAEATIFEKSGQPITMLELRRLFEGGYIPRTSKESCGGRCMVPSK